MENRIFIHDTLRSRERDVNFDIDNRIKELEQQKVLLEGSGFLSDEEIENTVERLKVDGQSYLVMREILERLQKETNYLHEWVENGFYEQILEDAIDKKIEDLNLKWKSDKPKGRGFFKGTGKIKNAYVVFEKPEPADIVRSLAKEGYLPKPIRVMGHERNHAYHHPSSVEDVLKRAFHNLRGDGGGSQELQEALANRTANMPVHRKTKEQVSERISPEKYPGVKEDRKEYAINAIDKLNALGLSPEEIGKIIMHHGGWDPTTKTYTDVEKGLRQLQEKRQISNSELEKIIEADKLEREVARLKAMLIAQEEISK